MKTKRHALQWVLLCVAACLALPVTAVGQNAVNVTVVADDASLSVGETTTVTVYGQIDPAIEEESSQIFSWYIDLLNSDGGVAAGYTNFQTLTSDNHPDTSSDGTPDGANLRGIYDTFLDAPGAGKGSPVVLAQFEVLALTAGTTTFSAAAGTTVNNHSTDFRVWKTGGGDDPLFTGGNYSAASVEITVTGSLDLSALNLTITVTGNEAELNFTPIPGYDHTAQWSPTMQSETWTDLPGGLHNSGTVLDDITGVTERFYRVLVTPQ